MYDQVEPDVNEMNFLHNMIELFPEQNLQGIAIDIQEFVSFDLCVPWLNQRLFICAWSCIQLLLFAKAFRFSLPFTLDYLDDIAFVLGLEGGDLYSNLSRKCCSHSSCLLFICCWFFGRLLCLVQQLRGLVLILLRGDAWLVSISLRLLHDLISDVLLHVKKCRHLLEVEEVQRSELVPQESKEVRCLLNRIVFKSKIW